VTEIWCNGIGVGVAIASASYLAVRFYSLGFENVSGKLFSYKKIISDCVLLILIVGLLFSSSLMVLNGDIAEDTPKTVKLLLSAVCFFVSTLILYGVFHKLARIKKLQGDWRIELNKDFIQLKTPDTEEIAPFKYNCNDIKKISREAYEDDGIWYKWFIHIEENGGNLKKSFDLGPFYEEKIIGKMIEMYGIDTVEIDINGATRKWNFSLWFKLKTRLSLILGTIILLSFLIPSFLYLAKVIRELSS
jgi:hypothetical protein